MSDLLAKSFDRHLSEIAGNDNSFRRRMHEAGWKDFIADARPETNDAVQMAVAALLHLGTVDQMSWSNEVKLLQAAFAFVKNYRMSFNPSPAQLISLKALLSETPVSEKSLVEWFESAQ